MYAIVAGFDADTEERVKKLWRGLAEEGISDYAARVEGRNPHITLATFEEVADNQAFQECLTAWCNSQSPLSFQVTSIGSFLESGALYLAPLGNKVFTRFSSTSSSSLGVSCLFGRFVALRTRCLVASYYLGQLLNRKRVGSSLSLLQG